MHLCILFKHFCFMQHNYNSVNDMLNIGWLLISIFAMSKGKKHLKTVRLQIFKENTSNENA